MFVWPRVSHLKETIRFAFDSRNPSPLLALINNMVIEVLSTLVLVVAGIIVAAFLFGIHLTVILISTTYPLLKAFLLPCEILIKAVLMALAFIVSFANLMMMMFMGLILPIMMFINMGYSALPHQEIVALKVLPRQNSSFQVYGPITLSSISMFLLCLSLNSAIESVILKGFILLFIVCTEALFLLLLRDR